MESQKSMNWMQTQIFNLLVGDKNDYAFPMLQKQALQSISNNVADLIYDSLQQRSSVNSSQRCNLLKFLNKLCQTPVFHLTPRNAEIYLHEYKNQFCGQLFPDTKQLVKSIEKEIEDIPVDIHSQVSNLYKRKNKCRKGNVLKLEYIKQMDQERLQNTNIQLQRNFSHYETNQSLIDHLLGCENVPSRPLTDTREFRKKQIGFAYAVINLSKDGSNICIIEDVLDKLLTYQALEPWEISFLEDLWLSEDVFTDLIMKKFPFIIEKIVIRFCSEILKLQLAGEVCQYFLNLDTNLSILKLRKLCRENLYLYLKLKSLIFELYVHSYCNENVYKFSDYIN